MTLIISYADKDGGIVVSDRFTSAGNRIANRNFNKLVHVLGEDCSLVVSFTGYAFIGPVPTDTKIVEWVCGQKINEKTISIVKGRHASRFRNASDIVSNIAKELKKEASKSYHLSLEVTISGQHIYRNKILPFFCVMRKSPRNFLVDISGSRPTSYLTHAHSHTFISGGYGQAYKDLGDKILNQVIDARVNSLSRSDLTKALVSGLQEFSDKNPFSIGRSVQIVTSSFIDKKSTISFENAMDFGPIEYPEKLINTTSPCNSPWILTPVGALAPITIYGSSMSYNTGEYTIDMVPSQTGSGISISLTR